LNEDFGVSADIWSVTSYKSLRQDAMECDRWNRLHPTQTPKKSYLETLLAKEKGKVFVAASDYMKVMPDMIAPWVPGPLESLGTDGFGRSESREALRRFFEVDAECIVIAALYGLCKEGKIEASQVEDAIKKLGVDPDKVDPVIS